jgi:HK97 family phage prohead protease
MTTMQTKALSAQIAPSASGFSAVITSETIDRDGEVLIPSGMNSKEFERNPTLFWNHDYAEPVGKAVGQLKRKEREIVADFVFAKRPDGYAGEFFPEVAAALVGQGIVSGVSVGYVPEEGGVRMATDIDRKKYGGSVSRIFSRWKLLEVSLAPLQANPEALITAVKKGLCSPVGAKRWFGIEVPKRIVVTVDVPARSTAQKRKPIDVDAVVRREIARAKGAVRI